MTDSGYAVRFLFIAGITTAFKQAIDMLWRGVRVEWSASGRVSDGKDAVAEGFEPGCFHPASR
jgi:hypothetical protein